MRIFSLILLLIYIGSEFFFRSGSHNTVIYIFIIWFVSTLMCSNWKVGALLKQRKYTYIYAFLVFYFISTAFGSNLYKASTSTLFMIRVFSPVLMYDILRQETIKTKRIITIVLMFFVLSYAFMATSILSRVGFESGLRGDFLTRGEDVYFETMFVFVYILPILVITLISATRCVSRETINNVVFVKIILISITVYLFLTVLRSFLMTAIILAIVGAAISVFYRRDKSLYNLAIKTTLTVSVLTVLFLFNYNIIYNHVVNIGNAAMIQRLEEVHGVMTGTLSQGSDLGSRNNLRTASINTFLSHPIFGVHHKYIDRVNENVIGNHAQWIDDLARYGVFAVLIFLFLFYALKKQYRDTNILMPVLFYVITGFLNPLLYPSSSINIFVIVPLLLESITTNNNQNNNYLIEK